MAQKTLYRSTENKSVSGLVAGLSDYLDVDVNFLRLVTLVLILFSGVIPGLVVYLIASAFVPVKPKEKSDA